MADVDGSGLPVDGLTSQVGWSGLRVGRHLAPRLRSSNELEMWANIQRDGRPAEDRWRPLFNAAVWLDADY